MLTSHENISVLTIDDDPDMRRSIVSYLEDMGFIVHQASGGREGIEMFGLHKPDLVFTDLMMPEVDGVAVVEAITKTSPDTPVVVISGNSSVEYAIKTVRKGAWDYITKPIHDFTQLEKVADRVLDRAFAIKSEKSYTESLQNAVLSQNRQITEISTLDQLTKLPTRNQIREKFSHYLINETFNGELFVILLEISNFKAVNETFGHEYGDAMICEIAHRLKSFVQPDVTLGRLGTDEFVLLTTNSAEPERFVTAIKEMLAEPVAVMEEELHTTYSIGIASFPHDGESVDALLQHADIARANAKIIGKNNCCYYSRELLQQMQDRIALESALRRALERKEFQLHYQPKLDAATRKMVGMEALIRWKPKGRDHLVSPIVFIPVLEETGLISEVGLWVLETACRQYMEWRSQGMDKARISVNVSAIQFNAGNLPEIVMSVLEKTGMPPEMLCLELTESIVVKDLVQTVSMLKKLAALGVKLSIDDFGTGYSSLSYLKEMPISELKIDRSFVMNLPHDPASIAIVESVMTLSKGMQLTVVAEGVETEEQADFLTSYGCNELQGYLFSKPMPSEELFGWCRRKNQCAEQHTLTSAGNWDNSHPVQHLAGGIAHDFKNLLTGVIGNLSIAKYHLDESHKSAQAIKRAEIASMRATELAQQLMNLSRPIAATKKTAQAGRIIDECVALSTPGSSIQFTINVDDNLPRISMAEGELSQVLNNLILNSAQAMNGKGTIAITAETVSIPHENRMKLSKGEYVRITVADCGCGMTPELLDKVFEPYFTTKPAGNGLGLASTNALIKKNLGAISMKSESGRGTTATVVLPVA